MENLKEFQRWKRLTQVPRPLRRLLWWVGLNIGRQRGNFFGTFGVSVYSALNAESLHPLSPLTALLNYGVIDKNGRVTARIMYDHRVMDGATIAARSRAHGGDSQLRSSSMRFDRCPALRPRQSSSPPQRTAAVGGG